MVSIQTCFRRKNMEKPKPILGSLSSRLRKRMLGTLSARPKRKSAKPRSPLCFLASPPPQSYFFHRPKKRAKHRWPFGQIDGPGKWNKPHLNQGPLFFRQTNQKGHLWRQGASSCTWSFLSASSRPCCTSAAHRALARASERARWSRQRICSSCGPQHRLPPLDTRDNGGENKRAETGWEEKQGETRGKPQGKGGKTNLWW